MPTFDEYFQNLKDAVKERAGEETAECEEFLESIKGDLEGWWKKYDSGDLSKENFESLLRGAASRALVHLLTEKGLDDIRIDQIRIVITNVIITVAERVG